MCGRAAVEWTDAAAIADLPDGSPVGIRVGMKAIVLVRRDDGVRAVDALCPHKFGPLEDGHIEDGYLACPLHDAHFHLESGHARPGGVTGTPLRIYPCRVEDGRVQVQF